MSGLTGRARIAGVMGWPVAHSRSPAIHRFWLRQLGIVGDYVAVAVAPHEITAFLQDFPKAGFRGGNVTVPHKEPAFAAAGEVGPAARAIRR